MTMPPGGMPLTADREAQLGRAFVRLADTLVSDYDVIELLDDLGDTCRALLDVDAAGIMLRRGDRLELASATSIDARDVEVFQAQADQGPCCDCVHVGDPISVPDLVALGDANPWPRFTEVALRRGIRAVHAIPLRLRSDVVGALNLFRGHPHAWKEADTTVATALADVATIGILQNRAQVESSALQAQLQHALDSRVLIEQAKGMLAAQASVTPDEAFVVLRAFCRSGGLQIRAVSQQVVEGSLDFAHMRAQRRR